MKELSSMEFITIIASIFSIIAGVFTLREIIKREEYKNLYYIFIRKIKKGIRWLKIRFNCESSNGPKVKKFPPKEM